ncbi:MAG: hypothetical protein JW751_00110, partial [Polyangiaceae bacterium]|nr:hypothetical protein [Polyangiaceae bacterium]
CWGAEANGRTQPPGGEFVALSAGENHTCGIRPGGPVACWGSNTSGQATPPGVPFSTIAAGYRHTCGRQLFGGGIRCWGLDTSGQAAVPLNCGNGTREPGEGCEDANTVAGDGCRSDCLAPETCGNGYADPGEICDDGQDAAGDTCGHACDVLWADEPLLPSPSLYLDFDALGSLDPIFRNRGRGPFAPGLAVGDPELVPAVVGSAVSLDGTDSEFVDLGELGPETESVSVAAWVRVTGASAAASAVIAEQVESLSGGLGWAMAIDPATPGPVAFWVGDEPNGGGFASVTHDGFGWDAWHHLAGTYDAATGALALYLDGQPVGAASSVGFTSIGYAESAFAIGAGLHGALDELAVWEEVLTAAEVLRLHRYGANRHPLSAHASALPPSSPCAHLLWREPGTVDGVRAFPISGSGSLVPLYCDMTGGGWTMLYKKSSGVPTAAEALWAGAPMNEMEITLLDRSQHASLDYASRLIQDFDLFSEARVELVTAGTAARALVFDALGSTSMGWFAPERYLAGGWTDLPTTASWEGSATGRYFSVSGQGERDFFVNYTGSTTCSAYQGWMLVTGPSGTCSFDTPAYTVRYAAGTARTYLTSTATADALVVFGQ